MSSNVWPPNYLEIFKWRQRQVLRLRKNPELIIGAKEYYRTRPVEFINHWCDTYDPRKANKKDRLTYMPLIMFDKQEELVEYLLAMIKGEESGLIEKSRDMGATWVCCAFSVWLWLYWEGASVGWGSRKELLVDKLGDPDSIFEKMRIIISRLPKFFLPEGFKQGKHCGYMKIVNPQNGSTITGEAGDSIGRGGRKLIYFKDESAHYERPEKIESALGDNTNTQIDISSVNGLGNVFQRKREAGIEWNSGQKAHEGVVNVFIMDWSDHPDKDQKWYDTRKRKAEREGLLHIFAQEVDRNYSAAVEGVIIPAIWVEAAIDAHVHLDLDISGGKVAALDVADEGRDKNAYCSRKGILLQELEEWHDRDTGVAARKTIGYAKELGTVEVQYDCIGVGSGVKSEVNRLKDEGKMPKSVKFRAWDASAAPFNKDKHMIKGDKESPLIGDFFQNLKAQGWWELRTRFEKTYKARYYFEDYPDDELISIPSNLNLLNSLKKELSQPTMKKSASMKVLVDKTPEGTMSPNLADSVMMCYHPVKTSSYSLRNL